MCVHGATHPLPQQPDRERERGKLVIGTGLMNGNVILILTSIC
jgi:hypothetical protein